MAARAARSCETARYKVQSGGAIGPDDAEGWVVEIFLARAGGAAPITLPPMSALMATSRLPAELDAPLGARGGGPVTVVDGPSSPDPALHPGWPSVTVRLGERYAAAYFDSTTRTHVVAIAAHLAEAIAADAAVLYARCAHLSFLDATGWVRGRDPATAGAALLWTIATQPDSVGKAGPRLDLLRQQVARLDGSAVLAAVGSAGGTAGTGTPMELRFPPAQPLAASSAARALAERLKKK